MRICHSKPSSNLCKKVKGKKFLGKKDLEIVVELSDVSYYLVVRKSIFIFYVNPSIGLAEKYCYLKISLVFSKFSHFWWILALFSLKFCICFEKCSFFLHIFHFFAKFPRLFALFFREIFELIISQVCSIFCQIFPFSIYRKYRIFSRNRLKRNFAKCREKWENFAFLARTAKFSWNSFPFSLETLAESQKRYSGSPPPSGSQNKNVFFLQSPKGFPNSDKWR